MSKPQYLIIAILLAFSLGLAHLVGNPGCAGNLRHDQTLRFEDQAIVVQKADDEIERQEGLSGLDCIGPNEGMLFVFDRSGQHSFWMNNMRFAIDILWLSDDKKVVDQNLNVQPSTYPQIFTNDQPAKYVLEIPAGRTAQLGLTQNSTLNF